MSFLQRFLERVLRTNTGRMPRTSFDDLSQDQLDAHLRVGRYGNFTLTDAVRPGVVVSPKGRWAKLNGGRNVNWTTSDALADMAGQSTFHSNRVWLRRADTPCGEEAAP